MFCSCACVLPETRSRGDSRVLMVVTTRTHNDDQATFYYSFDTVRRRIYIAGWPASERRWTEAFQIRELTEIAQTYF
jgi:hypothetical protein